MQQVHPRTSRRGSVALRASTHPKWTRLPGVPARDARNIGAVHSKYPQLMHGARARVVRSRPRVATERLRRMRLDAVL